MKWKALLPILICAIALVGGISYYSIVPKTVGLSVTMISGAVPAVFPTIVNVTSIIENTNSREVGSLNVLQTMPEGFNLTGVYLAEADGSRLPYNPVVTGAELNYPMDRTLEPKEKIGVIVLFQSTPKAISGNFTTAARGTYDTGSISSQGVVQVHVERSSTCTDWDTISLGEFLLVNNVWGGPKEPHIQCVSVGPATFGWNSTRLSPSDNSGPYYPEVIYGKSPSSTVSTTSNLPVKIESLESLDVSMDVSMKPYTKYNFAFDIWITNNTESSLADITDEVMVWLVWTPGQEGEYVLDTLVDGYNLYQHRVYDITSPVEQNRYDQFTAAKQGIPSKINLLAFLNHLRKEKDDLRYLASIELGNEVWSGEGVTSVTMFRIDLKTKQNLGSPVLQDEAGYLQKVCDLSNVATASTYAALLGFCSIVRACCRQNGFPRVIYAERQNPTARR
jgi:hypothetical protein